MEISVKLYTGELAKVFDTTKDKKKKVVLTTIKDFQRNAEVEIYNKKRKIKTLHFLNLPLAKAREIDLPVTIEVMNKDFFTIAYVDKDKKVKIHEVSLKEFKMKNLIRTLIPIAGILLFLVLLFFLIMAFIKNYDKIANYFNSIKKEKVVVQEETEKEPELTVEEEKEEPVAVYTVDSLQNIIAENSPIHFAADKDILLEGEDNKIRNIINYMKNYKELELIINGHTESINLPENEYALSVKRAKKIKGFFDDELKDITLKISTKGFGATKKAVDNAPKEEQYLNRRVEINVVSAE